IRPGTTLGFGPPVDDGFYYDFILPEPITENDFPEIEKRMQKIIQSGQEFSQIELSPDEALEKIRQMKEPHKEEYAQELIDKKGLTSLSFYKNGPFEDMCEGPHVVNSRHIPTNCFKLRATAGAYWRGNSDNVMMTRIYAWAFSNRKDLQQHIRNFEEAQARDHKKLGKELDIFLIDEEIGKGLPLWLPHGTVIRDELEKLAKELEFKAGYQRVATPHLTKTSLYYKTGHLPYYEAHMYPLMEIVERGAEACDCDAQDKTVKESYALKPMNCPHHHRIFSSRRRSYRELPLRLAEYGTVYRFEDSGSLSGLLRVRAMTMNDAHIYCTEEQIKEEFLAVMEMHKEVYKILGLENYFMRFSTWDPEDPKGKEKYVDNPEAWEKTQRLVEEAMKDSGIPYVEGKGEAAFYGPKIDVQFTSVTGREETASTNQLDFCVPERLGMTYLGPDNKEYHPYIIHRAPLGTHERFIAFLIEHYGGAFPAWLAPVQVKVLSVTDAFSDYGRKITETMRQNFIRAEFDDSSETLNKRIRTSVTAKIPNILVVGEREAQNETVTLRRYGVKRQQTLPFTEFMQRLQKTITERSQTFLD
ncbi:threonine--tRNA ligase, partial [Magnetococcales bacterium HHB-1]